MKTILMIVHQMQFKQGGITNVMMNRSYIFNDLLGYKSHMLTFDSNPENDYIKLEEEFKSIGRLHRDSKIINLYDYFSFKNTVDENFTPIEDTYNDNSDLLVQKQFYHTRKFLRFFSKDGQLVKTQFFSKEDVLQKEELYDNENRLNIVKFYKRNRLFKILKYEDKIEIEERLFTTDGFCFFLRLNRLGDYEKEHLFLLDRKSNTVIGFNDRNKLYAYFIEELCVEKNSRDNVVICDGPGSVNKVVGVNKNKARRLLTIHTNHYQAPYKYGALVKKDVGMTIRNAGNVDGVIVLTHEQKKDIVKEFGNENKYFVIPNTILSQANFIKDKKSNKKVISVISRYASSKQLNHVILAVDRLRKRYSINSSMLDVRLYGIGSQQISLEKLVAEHNLEDMVTVGPYVTDVNEAFREADITLMTSTYEGFGLTLIEAMSNKTPVISYDINYGPRDIISDEEDGFLVKSNDIKALSEKLYNVLFTNDYKMQWVAENSFRKINTKFSHEQASELWKDLLNNKLE